MADADAIAHSVLKRFEQASADRGIWESHWEEVAKRVFPSYAGSFQAHGLRTPGEKRTEDMVDASAALALPKFAAAMESMLTPRNQTWHKLVPLDKTLRRNRVAKLWYEDVNEALFRYRYAPRANCASQVHEVYMGLGSFGTSGMLIDKLRWPGERGLRYQTIHLGEIYFLENHQGIIDTAMRRFEMTARQAFQKWGDALPSDILECAKDPARYEKKFWFVHCVTPRVEEEGYDPARLDVKGMRFASRYVAESGKKLIAEGGFNTFPYAISRYVIAPGETYGRSPAMLALPSIKVLNEEKKTYLTQGHRAASPVLLAFDDGVLDTFSMKPGALNAGGVSAEGRPLVHVLPSGNIAITPEMMSEERAVINDAFLVTLFQILVETPRMTATEVLERVREKGALLSPTMGRQQSEFLGPMVEREIDVLGSQGLLPPMPAIVREAKAEYDTVYDSPLSRAQRAEQATGFMRLVDWATPYIQVSGDTSPLDHLDWDVAIPELADIQGVPARWVRDSNGVAAIRQGRAQQAAQQQAVDALPGVGGLMKAMPNGTPA